MTGPDNLVREYTHWNVYLFRDQLCIGRAVVWCTREDALQLTDATPEEREELFQILTALKNATEKEFGASWFNYALLGNVDRHLHCHFLPRYDKPVTFEGELFTDPKYDGNPFAFTDTHPVSDELFEKIKERLASAL